MNRKISKKKNNDKNKGETLMITKKKKHDRPNFSTREKIIWRDGEKNKKVTNLKRYLDNIREKRWNRPT